MQCLNSAVCFVHGQRLYLGDIRLRFTTTRCSPTRVKVVWNTKSRVNKRCWRSASWRRLILPRMMHQHTLLRGIRNWSHTSTPRHSSARQSGAEFSGARRSAEELIEHCSLTYLDTCWRMHLHQVRKGIQSFAEFMSFSSLVCI